MDLKKSYLLLISCFVVIIASLFSLQIYMCLTPLSHNVSGTVYDLHPGTSKRLFINQLNARGNIPNVTLFSIYVYLYPGAKLKTGEYFFPSNSSLHDVWRDVTAGSNRFYHAFTIVPGWSFKQLKVALARVAGLKLQLSSVTDEQLMKTLGQSGKNPEGYFFPDTYFYTKGDSDKVILQKAFNLMQVNLQKAWANRSRDIPFTTPYEALIAASLIEKEAHLNIELTRISGVLVNRLRKGMLLQFDPTVIYAMGDHYDGRINKTDLRINDLHNTYLHKGLPPTPIAMPSLKAIQAALHPEMHDYYYFVARGDGSHIFSKSLAEHNQAVSLVSPPSSILPKQKAPYVNTMSFQQELLNHF